MAVNVLKGKAVPLQAWSGPEGSRKLRFPDFMTTAQDGGNVVSLTHRPPLPPGNTPSIARAERDGTRAETRFRLSLKRTSPFKSVGVSLQSTAGSRGVRISLSNAGYTTFGGGVRVLATHSIRQFPLPSRALPCAIRFRTSSTIQRDKSNPGKWPGTHLCVLAPRTPLCAPFNLLSFLCLFVSVRNLCVWFDRYWIRHDSCYRSVAVTGCGPLFESRTQFLGCDNRLATLVQFVQ